jgi:hypothetical protein
VAVVVLGVYLKLSSVRVYVYHLQVPVNRAFLKLSWLLRRRHLGHVEISALKVLLLFALRKTSTRAISRGSVELLLLRRLLALLHRC